MKGKGKIFWAYFGCVNKTCFNVRLFVQWHQGMCPNRISVCLNLPPVRYAAGLLSVYHLQKALSKKIRSNTAFYPVFYFSHQSGFAWARRTHLPIIREWEQRGEPPPPRWVNFRGELITDQIITYWSKFRSTSTFNVAKNIFRGEKSEYHDLPV